MWEQIKELEQKVYILGIGIDELGRGITAALVRRWNARYWSAMMESIWNKWIWLEESSKMPFIYSECVHWPRSPGNYTGCSHLRRSGCTAASGSWWLCCASRGRRGFRSCPAGHWWRRSWGICFGRCGSRARWLGSTSDYYLGDYRIFLEEVETWFQVVQVFSGRTSNEISNAL
jgi:hypothetical protein